MQVIATEKSSDITALDIQLHQKSRLLEIKFSDGEVFKYPCEYLRVKSHAAEVRALGRPETGKEKVNIDEIEQQGSYAIRMKFDDGHDTGIYSWAYLYDPGKNFDKYWQDYLEALDVIGYKRNENVCG